MTTAVWRVRDGRWTVWPSDWPARCVLVFSELEQMVEWAHGTGYMLIRRGR